MPPIKKQEIQLTIHIGKRIRLARALQGNTQENIGKAMGLSAERVHEYEQGFYELDVECLQRFAKALDVPVDYFFVGVDASMADTVH